MAGKAPIMSIYTGNSKFWMVHCHVRLPEGTPHNPFFPNTQFHRDQLHRLNLLRRLFLILLLHSFPATSGTLTNSYYVLTYYTSRFTEAICTVTALTDSAVVYRLNLPKHQKRSLPWKPFFRYQETEPVKTTKSQHKLNTDLAKIQEVSTVPSFMEPPSTDAKSTSCKLQVRETRMKTMAGKYPDD